MSRAPAQPQGWVKTSWGTKAVSHGDVRCARCIGGPSTWAAPVSIGAGAGRARHDITHM